MDISTLKREKLILLDCISGSKAYGLDTPQSDTDKRGVFYVPKRVFYGMSKAEQISNDTNDEAYTELGRFFELLGKSNPTMIELLNTPEESVLVRHPLMREVRPELYLSKKCKDSFAGYAVTQIRKARGLNKKIHNPMSKEKKSVVDFCYVPKGQGAVPLLDFLQEKGMDMANCGLVRIPHMHEVYGLYYGEGKGYRGIVSGQKANEVSLSQVMKDDEPVALVSFNQSGYSKYCKEYKEYWEWVELRNDDRYHNTLSHGKNYDAKNMMHTFRLLAMAHEIASEGKVIVKRPDREFLLKIRSGAFSYEDLLAMAEERIAAMNEAYAESELPEEPNVEGLNDLLIQFREEVYN